MSLYLVINLASISVPLLFSFHPRIQFHKEWKYAIPAILLAAIPYLIWDEIFTRAGIWGFNPTYIGDLALGELPLEEVLFFICIPYACLFTYFVLSKLTAWSLNESWNKGVTICLSFLFVLMIFFAFDKWYTLVNAAFALIILVVTYKVKPNILKKFIPVYLLILIPFMIVNGILTGFGIQNEVVWYNNLENMNIRIGTIPLEDFFYAFSMLLLSVLLFTVFKAKSQQSKVR